MSHDIAAVEFNLQRCQAEGKGRGMKMRKIVLFVLDYGHDPLVESPLIKRKPWKEKVIFEFHEATLLVD